MSALAPTSLSVRQYLGGIKVFNSIFCAMKPKRIGCPGCPLCLWFSGSGQRLVDHPEQIVRISVFDRRFDNVTRHEGVLDIPQINHSIDFRRIGL